MRTHPALLIASAVLSAGVLAACSSGATRPGGAEPAPEVVSSAGTVVYCDLEGGFWVIQEDGGSAYDAHDLPAEFKVDGLKVAFTVRVLKDALCFHMAGPIVTVIEITKAP